MQLAGVVARVSAAPPRCGPVRVVAIDGGAAAGKSTLAGELAAALPRAAVVHLDDLLDGWDDQFGYADRLAEQVLEPLAAGRTGRYRRYDWVADQFGDQVEVPVPETLIVEGVSAIWGCRDRLSLGIFLDLPRPVRLRRWIDRDGPLRPEWLRWLAAEDAFFAAHPLPPDTLVR
jgi:uridine kinase